MFSRNSRSATSPYDPSQWTPMSQASSPQHGFVTSMPRYAPRLLGPDEPVASPPPPYSPRRESDAPRREDEILSPAETTSPDTDASHYNTPLTSANIASPAFAQSASRAAVSVQNDLPYHQFAPPPTAQNAASKFRSSSREHAGRLLSSLSSRNRSCTNVTSPHSAVDPFQYRSSNVSNASVSPQANPVPIFHAPAARRAASTSNIPIHGEVPRLGPHSSPIQSFDQRLPPPPPPGPPPSQSFQSHSRNLTDTPYSPTPERPVVLRRPPGQGTPLDSVPPTPADWREDVSASDAGVSQFSASSELSRSQPLHVDTSAAQQSLQSGTFAAAPASGGGQTHVRRDSASPGLFRAPAVRRQSAKGLRERRSESKHDLGRSQGRSASQTDFVGRGIGSRHAPRPLNLDLRAISVSGAANNHSQSSAPEIRHQSTQSNVDVGESSKASESNIPQPNTSHSVQVTPITLDNGANLAGPESSRSESYAYRSMNQWAKSPISSSSSTLRRPLKINTNGNYIRPISHILHTPIDGENLKPPLNPSRSTTCTRLDTGQDHLGQSDEFSLKASERHEAFIQREASAQSDAERLDLFVQFITSESRIRRQRYASVFADDDVDFSALGTHLFCVPNLGDVELTDSAMLQESSSREDSLSGGDDVLTGSQRFASPSSATSGSSLARHDGGPARDYIPCLSPIASMSIVTGAEDEMNSRGRAPSRWWEEGSQGGPSSSTTFDILGRSKRESKYMGVGISTTSKVTRSSLASEPQIGTIQAPVAVNDVGSVPISKEIQSEKPVWSEGLNVQIPPPPAMPPPLPPTPQSAPPKTPHARGLDISRLVTLPPPYPRHHPAMNNSHPTLAGFRANLRTLDSKKEVQSVRNKYESDTQARRERLQIWSEQQLSNHKQILKTLDPNNTESKVRATAVLVERINKMKQEHVQAEFDLFQDMVVTPVHEILTSRIKLATSTLDSLSGQFFKDSQTQSPNLPQEEGDEQPELLEKVTLLKWLFEAREALHRLAFDLLSDRNEKYKAVVLLPFTQAKNTAQSTDANDFFAKDHQSRLQVSTASAMQRTCAFRSIIEKHVTRGVEIQLDAFWQIAPQLRNLLLEIPRSDAALVKLELRISPDEYMDNPSYERYPLLYLSSLLSHAEKATRQFIDSQVNLLCLLHEVRCCALGTEVRPEHGDGRAQEGEEKRLTLDLKDRVAVVEGQWADALGEELRHCRETVRGALLEQGGWDEEAEEELAV